MGKIVPAPVERYLAQLNRHVDAVLADVAAEGARRHLPLIDAEVGALLHVQALAVGARRALEIGTAIGYSGIWLARALPAGGMLISIERDPGRAAEARENFRRAGVSDRASVMVGEATRLLEKVAGPFDVIFQDGDKKLYEPLLDRLIGLLRPGGVLVADNVLRNGDVVPGFGPGAANLDDTAKAIAGYNERLRAEPRLVTAWVPLRDGLSISVRT